MADPRLYLADSINGERRPAGAHQTTRIPGNSATAVSFGQSVGRLYRTPFIGS